MGDGFHGGFGSFGLLRCDGANSSEHGGVDGASIEEEGSEDFLDSFGVGGVEGRRGVFHGGILGRRTIIRLDPGVRGMLWVGRCRMLKSLEGAFDVARDGDVAGSVNVVKSERESAVLLGVPIDAGGVQQSQSVQEVLGVVRVGVLDAEVVDD